jgi:hypothetical protein
VLELIRIELVQHYDGLPVDLILRRALGVAHRADEGVDVTIKNDTLSQRVQSSYKQLAVAATALNAASDELGNSISALDVTLKKLALGIPAWLKIAGDEDQYGNYWSRHIGYAKIGTKWGIALSNKSGNENYPSDSKCEEWLFNDAPRSLRIEAIDKIPDLLDTLITKAEEATRKIQDKIAEAKQLASTINEVAAQVTVKRK